MREIVIGDIHAGFRALEALVKQIKPTVNDRLIFLGDYVDGWSEALETIDYLMELSGHCECIFMKGNHDTLALDWLENGKANPLWLEHGGSATVASYSGQTKEKIKNHIEFYYSLKPFYLDSQNRLFVHAGFTNQKGVSHEYFEKNFYWDRTLWETALCLNPSLEIGNLLYPKRFKLYKEIFIGHSSLDKIGLTKPVQKANVWNIDTAAAFKGPLSAMDVNSKEIWQSSSVFQYYPDEQGRNPQ